MPILAKVFYSKINSQNSR